MFGAFTLPPCCTVAWKPSPHAERTAARLRELLAKHGIKRAYAAALMGLEERDLNDQLACAKPLNHYRLEDLFAAHPELADEYHQLALEERGWRVIRDAVMGELVDTVRELKDLLPPRKRMAKAALVSAAERKQA